MGTKLGSPLDQGSWWTKAKESGKKVGGAKLASQDYRRVTDRKKKGKILLAQTQIENVWKKSNKNEKNGNLRYGVLLGNKGTTSEETRSLRSGTGDP